MGRREVQKPDFTFPNIYSSVDFVSKTAFNAYTILAAAIDNSPGPVEIAEQTLLGRITGGTIAALTPAQVRALLDIEVAPSYISANEPYTQDHGLKWTDLGVISAAEATVLISLGDGIAILADLGTHVYRTTDYGATWTDLGSILNAATAGAYLGNGIVLLADELGHIFRSTDYGITWTDLGAIGIAFYVLLNLGFGIAIAGSNNRHVWRSTNYGVTWIDLGIISASNIYSGAYLSNGIVIIGDASKHIYRSPDYGATWLDLGITTGSSIEEACYLGFGVALIATLDHHLWRSSNYGVTWTDYGAVLGDTGNAITWLGWGTAIVGASNGHVYRTNDFGLTWTDLGAIASSSILSSCFLGHGVTLISDNNGHILRSTAAFGFGEFSSHREDLLFQFGCLGAITPNGTSYLAPGNGATQTNEIRIRVPRSGILRNLYVWQRVASGAGGRTDIYTVRVNGADKAITCTLDNATTGQDTTHAVPVAAGDAVSIKLVSNNASDTSADVTASLTLT